MRRIIRGGLALAAVAAVTLPAVDLQACGDKFLRAGRSSRMNNYAAMYPATILLYPSPTAKPQVVSKWQKMLKDAGHRAQVIGRSADLSAVVASGAYDLVITDYGSAARVRTDVMAARSQPGVLPVLTDSNKALTSRAQAEFEHFIDPGMTPRETLAEIDHVMEVRLRKLPAGNRP